MSPAQAATAVAHGLHSRWMRCSRNLKLAAKALGLISALVTVLSFMSAHARAFVHDEVATQVIPIVAKIDDLHQEVMTLKGNLANVASVSEVNAQLTVQLNDIKALLVGLQKKAGKAP